MNLKVGTITNPDVLGELLRELTFRKNRPEDVGCYSTFDLQEGFVKTENPETLNPLRQILGIDETDPLEAFENEALGLLVAWAWDGDGILFFEVEDEDSVVMVINDDCKKNYNWCFVEGE